MTSANFTAPMSALCQALGLAADAIDAIVKQTQECINAAVAALAPSRGGAPNRSADELRAARNRRYYLRKKASETVSKTHSDDPKTVSDVCEAVSDVRLSPPDGPPLPQTPSPPLNPPRKGSAPSERAAPPPRSAGDLFAADPVAEPVSVEILEPDQIDLPKDDKAWLFAFGLTYLEASGLKPDKARRLLGKWTKECGGDAGPVRLAVEDAIRARPFDPVSFITAILNERSGSHGNEWGQSGGSRGRPARGYEAGFASAFRDASLQILDRQFAGRP